MAEALHVLIVRDREAAGGGIFNYYRAISKHQGGNVTLVDVGRAHGFYGIDELGSRGAFSTLQRLLRDWWRLATSLSRFPDLVMLNPCLDPVENRSLPRDAVNLLLAKLFRRKVLVFWRGWDNDACGTPEFPGGNRGWLSRVYRLADAHIVLASDFRDDLRRWGFTSPVYLESTVVADEVLALRLDGLEEVPDSNSQFRILYLSRVEVAKGVFEMLDAFALLESGDPGRYHFTIAGDGPALEELKLRAGELGLSGVEFTGYVHGPGKARCFADADAFCFLSYTEGMPNAVLEAMAMGLPLVSSDAGGLKDILTDDVTGYILRQDRSQPAGKRFLAAEVADRLKGLANSPEKLKRMGEHNRSYARERFAAAKVAARLDTIYGEVCDLPQFDSRASSSF
ncbi:MAG: glycosyltransferase family 4 protein [Verrucomicrobiota bacterium]